MSKSPRYWTPLQEAPKFTFGEERIEVVKTAMDHYGISEAEARAWLKEYHDKSRYYVNDLYQVQASTEGPFLHLNIRRRDGGMFKDWRHFQMIKNEIAGPEREAVELYPAESRKVDTSNKWHLWVLPEGQRVQVGWPQRDVLYEENRNVPGLRQRPL
jgi:hypothetical protein